MRSQDLKTSLIVIDHPHIKIELYFEILIEQNFLNFWILRIGRSFWIDFMHQIFNRGEEIISVNGFLESGWLKVDGQSESGRTWVKWAIMRLLISNEKWKWTVEDFRVDDDRPVWTWCKKPRIKTLLSGIWCPLTISDGFGSDAQTCISICRNKGVLTSIPTSSYSSSSRESELFVTKENFPPSSVRFLISSKIFAFYSFSTCPARLKLAN